MKVSADGGTILPLVLERLVYEVRGVRLIDGIDLELRAGERSVILGPNGAGKSLTLRMAHGLLRPSSGRVLWKGAGGAGARLRQAMVFERSVLLRRPVRANIDWALRIRGLGRDARRERTAMVLERTGLTALASRPARALSAGEQQRLAMARAWALAPEVLFLDEPTAALDPAASHRIEILIEAISAAGTKIVMTTHDLAQARRLAQDVIVLHRGRVLERGTATRFFDKPDTLEAQAFLRGELLG